MSGLFFYVLFCTGAPNCPPQQPVYSNDIQYSERSCRDTAPRIAASMHYQQGGEWTWKCIPADYIAKEAK